MGSGYSGTGAAGPGGFYGGRHAEQPQQQQMVVREQPKPPEFREDQAASFFPEFRFFVDQQGLGPVFDDTPLVVMGSGMQLRQLQQLHGDRKVRDHQRVFNYLLRAFKNSSFRPRLMQIGSVSGAWEAVVLFYLPTSDAEKEGIKRRLSTLKMKKGEDPRVYFLRFDEALALFRTVDGVLSQTEELAMLRRNLSEDYSQLLTHLLLDSSMNRALFEQRVRTFYIEHDLGNPARQSVVPASLSTAIVATDPHALRFGGGGRAHGGGRGMHARGMHSSDDARPQDRQRPQQRGWGFGPQHQPQHQRPQRFPSLSGQVGQVASPPAPIAAMPVQQQLQTRQRAVPPNSGFIPGSATDPGRNAVWFQPDGPAPPGAVMGEVHTCGRCGHLEHQSSICLGPTRFYGRCMQCGENGHVARFCKYNPATTTLIQQQRDLYHRGQSFQPPQQPQQPQQPSSAPHLNAVMPAQLVPAQPHSAPVSQDFGVSGGFVQQQQRSILGVPLPQQHSNGAHSSYLPSGGMGVQPWKGAGGPGVTGQQQQQQQQQQPQQQRIQQQQQQQQQQELVPGGAGVGAGFSDGHGFSGQAGDLPVCGDESGEFQEMLQLADGPAWDGLQPEQHFGSPGAGDQVSGSDGYVDGDGGEALPDSFGTVAVGPSPPDVGHLNAVHFHHNHYPAPPPPVILAAMVAAWWVGDNAASVHSTPDATHVHNMRSRPCHPPPIQILCLFSTRL